jgi:hypothetical protein
MQDKLSTFCPKTISVQELDLVIPEKDPKECQVRSIFHELYEFGIVITFHIDVKVTRISSQPLLAKNLNILHNFGEYPAKFENIKDLKSLLGVFGDTYTVTSSTFCPFTRRSAAQASPHNSEAANLNDVFAIFCLSSIMRR